MNKNRGVDWLNKAFRYRWLIGLVLLILAVAFEINGSSVGMWNVHIPNGQDPKADFIIGRNRAIRSDEWCLFTPMAVSQYYNDFGITSDIVRGTETDVFMVYGQPVRDWSIIFRPFQIGYLFLNPAQGLSFYWMGKLIALFLVSLEFGLLLTKRKKLLALSWAFAISMAPVVQWWFSTNAFPDMLVYGQGIILLLHGYLHHTCWKKRILFALGLAWLCGAYLLVIYPAWQIPFFYVFLVPGLWVILSGRKTFSLSWKKDLPILGGALLLLVLSMALIISRSWEAIQTVMGSVYPGERMETGGIGIKSLVMYPGNLFLPLDFPNVPFNECETAVFFDLFPLGLLGAGLCLHKGKPKDGLTIGLLIAFLFLGIYTVIGFPGWLAKITLLNNCQGRRVGVALSFVNLLLFFRSMALLEEDWPKLKLPVSLLLALVLGFSVATLSRATQYSEYFTNVLFLAAGVVLSGLFFLVLAKPRWFCLALCVLSLAIGGTVNPIRHGISSLTDTKPAQAIRQYASESDGKWLAVSENWVIGDYLIASGAHTLNSLNTYINRDLWKVLDPDGTSEDIYNRYAHIIGGLTNEDESEISLVTTDCVSVLIPVSKLKELGVEYLFSNQDLEEYNTENYLFETVFSDAETPYRIYRFTDNTEPVL